MGKRKKFILGAVLVLVVALGVYRLWPWPFDSVVGRELGEMTVVSCWLRVSDYTPEKPGMSFYNLDVEEPERMDEIIDILMSCGYQKGFRNLWPGGAHGLSSGRNYDGRDISVTLVFGEHKELFNLMLVDRSKGITIDNEIVHLTDSGVFDRLAELILENGVAYGYF